MAWTPWSMLLFCLLLKARISKSFQGRWRRSCLTLLFSVFFSLSQILQALTILSNLPWVFFCLAFPSEHAGLVITSRNLGKGLSRMAELWSIDIFCIFYRNLVGGHQYQEWLEDWGEGTNLFRIFLSHLMSSDSRHQIADISRCSILLFHMGLNDSCSCRPSWRSREVLDITKIYF